MSAQEQGPRDVDAKRIRVGISGWTYAPWRGVFYPKGLPQKQELPYAASRLRTIEINGTFYRLQRPESFEHWHDETPDDFVFSVKAPRFITHVRRLKDVEAPLSNFLASGVLRLQRKLGPILWQFPPSMRFDPARFESFLAMLPSDTATASERARHHDDWMRERSATDIDANRPLRHAVEIRHESFRVPAFVEMLRRHRVALVCADTVEWPRLMDVTSDFVYCRLHGPEELYANGYDDDALGDWARRVRAWARGGEPDDAERVLPGTRPIAAGRDVFVYFDTDTKVRAPVDAASLAARLQGASTQ